MSVSVEDAVEYDALRRRAADLGLILRTRMKPAGRDALRAVFEVEVKREGEGLTWFDVLLETQSWDEAKGFLAGWTARGEVKA